MASGDPTHADGLTVFNFRSALVVFTKRPKGQPVLKSSLPIWPHTHHAVDYLTQARFSGIFLNSWRRRVFFSRFSPSSQSFSCSTASKPLIARMLMELENG